MKFSPILSIGIILLIFTTGYAEAQEGTVTERMNDTHYLVVGHIYEPYTQDNIVILTNIRTGKHLQVTAISCEHDLKEYLFNLANLKDGWNREDIIVISYGNQSTVINILVDSVGAQVDLNKPSNWDPILILAGSSLVVLSGGIYFYMKRKKIHNEEYIMEESKEIEKKGFKLFNDFGVRALIATMMVLGYIGSAALTVYTGNEEMLRNVTTIYSPIIMAIITFYFMGSVVRDIKKQN